LNMPSFSICYITVIEFKCAACKIPAGTVIAGWDPHSLGNATLLGRTRDAVIRYGCENNVVLVKLNQISDAPRPDGVPSCCFLFVGIVGIRRAYSNPGVLA